MLKDGNIYAGRTDDGRQVSILPKMANRHGLIAGATGTGKTVTLKVLAESFSDLGVPVFLADVKGDLAGMIAPGTESDDMKERIKRFELEGTGFSLHSYPAVFWDLYGKKGIQLRTTISQMGPILLSRILGLNQVQSQILAMVFKIADDNSLLLIDTKDLKSMLSWVDDHRSQFKQDYGNISTASVAAIVRAVNTLETAGGDIFFGEPDLAVQDLFSVNSEGKGVINILDSESLINNPLLYSTFLLWLMSELFENLPEVGDADKPKMVFFFDEAHLLFDNASKELLDKIEQVVRLIRSKGIGIWFISQNPSDIPDQILGQLGNKIQHALRAYTPSEQKKVKAAALSFRENPAFDTYDAILNLENAQALVSFLDEKGTPGISERIYILPPQSRMGTIDDADRETAVRSSLLYSKYAQAVDPDSAYEVLQRRGAEEEKAAADARQKEKEEAAQAKAEAAQAKEKARQEEKQARQKQRAAKTVASTLAGTIGREAGKTVGKNFGRFGRTLGGNVGASLARGILSTLLKN